ncbi:MAG: DNA topoisomerase IB [Kofleriaceae bacterium]|nr:DNA topoisomerase IB [Kofleriaceae bacterium]
MRKHRHVQLARMIENPEATASAADLNYATDGREGISRHRRGKSFAYYAADGRPVRDRDTLARIRALAIPPAWTHVWISADPHGHIQATGRDARGRKQYRYHPKWREVRDAVKYYRLVDFCHALPRIRRAVEHDLACKCLCKRKVVATIVSLMERAQLRVGNEEYARTNQSYGATTLRNHHVKVRGPMLELSYRGKSGIERRVRVRDRKLAAIVRQCHDLPGRRLFEYIDDDGNVRPVSSQDVNDYLRDVSGGPFTAKDYRTWAATMAAAMLFCALEHPGSVRGCKQCIKEVLGKVSAQLGHTPTVCRKSYIHPQIIDDFTDNRLEARLSRGVRRAVRNHDGDEIDVVALRAVEPIVARYLDTKRRARA